jgi:hypothetical protein
MERILLEKAGRPEFRENYFKTLNLASGKPLARR